MMDYATIYPERGGGQYGLASSITRVRGVNFGMGGKWIGPKYFPWSYSGLAQTIPSIILRESKSEIQPKTKVSIRIYKGSSK